VIESKDSGILILSMVVLIIDCGQRFESSSRRHEHQEGGGKWEFVVGAGKETDDRQRGGTSDEQQLTCTQTIESVPVS
jgi:hypothetical protein